MSIKEKVTQSWKKMAILLPVSLFIILSLLQSSYQVNEQEQAVVTTLGKPQLISTTGIHFKVPWVQKVQKVPTTISGFSIGYNSDTKETIELESLMITKDYNFVNVDFYVEYRVSDPIKYLYAAENPQSVLKMLAQSYIRDTIGLFPVDDVITTGKNEIQAEITTKLTDRLVHEDIGLTLVRITIQDSEPPTQDVLSAFKAVETAKQGKETALNNANRYQSEQIPAAEAQADEILQQAEAAAAARKNEAIGQVSRFNEMYEQYELYPLITKQRMFYEAMEKILPKLKIVIDNGSSTSKVLPLESFVDPMTFKIGGSEEKAADSNTNTQAAEEDSK